MRIPGCPPSRLHTTTNRWVSPPQNLAQYRFRATPGQSRRPLTGSLPQRWLAQLGTVATLHWVNYSQMVLMASQDAYSIPLGGGNCPADELEFARAERLRRGQPHGRHESGGERVHCRLDGQRTIFEFRAAHGEFYVPHAVRKRHGDNDSCAYCLYSPAP